MAAELRFIGQIAPAAALNGGPAIEQAHSALTALQRVLAADHELALEDLLRLRLFVRDLGELPAIEAAIDASIGSQRPAVSIVELPGDPAEPGVALTLDAVAASGAGEHRRLLPHSARFGPWVFLGAVTAPEPQRELPREQRILRESRALFAHLEELLRAQGARLRDVVKVGGWLTFPMSDYGPLGETRSALVGEAGLLPASAAVQVARVGSEGELLAFEAIAYAPEDRGGHADSESPSEHGADDERADAGRPTAETTSRLADFYLDARAAGGYVFTSGEVPDGRGSPAEQAHEVYERLRAHLAAHGATPADVRQQTVFVRAAEDGEHSGAAAHGAAAHGAVVSEAARAFYGANATTLPSTTVLPVADIGFHPGCAVEIELIAASDGRSADDR
jgi:enamine deaminase RidA (YjgF/YER057c/UK114 family)